MVNREYFYIIFDEGGGAAREYSEVVLTVGAELKKGCGQKIS